MSQTESSLPFSEQRLKICNECPEYHHYLCRRCGCFMPVKAKFPNVKCPLDKWGPEDKKNTGV